MTHVDMTRTNRGFSLLRFADADGAACSIQDSSLAEEACVWLGRDGADHQVRMHLTQDMARILVGHIRSDVRESLHFLDRYGSKCVVNPSEPGMHSMEVGIVLDFEGRDQRPMRLTSREKDVLIPILSRFADQGSISGIADGDGSHTS